MYSKHSVTHSGMKSNSSTEHRNFSLPKHTQEFPKDQNKCLYFYCFYSDMTDRLRKKRVRVSVYRIYLEGQIHD